MITLITKQTPKAYIAYNNLPSYIGNAYALPAIALQAYNIQLSRVV